MAINLTPEEFLDLLDRYNTNVKGKSRKDLEKANEELRNVIAQNAADKKLKGTGITPNLNRFKPNSFNGYFTWGDRHNQVANTMDALQYSSALDDGTVYPEDKLRAFADFMSKLDIPSEYLNDVLSDPVKVATAFDYYTQHGLPINYDSRSYTFDRDRFDDQPLYRAYDKDIYSKGGIPTVGHYIKSKVLSSDSNFSKQVQEIYKPKKPQPSTPVETQEVKEVKEVSPVEEAVQNTPNTTTTPAVQEVNNADWLADELRKSYKKDPRGFERLGTW